MLISFLNPGPMSLCLHLKIKQAGTGRFIIRQGGSDACQLSFLKFCREASLSVLEPNIPLRLNSLGIITKPRICNFLLCVIAFLIFWKCLPHLGTGSFVILTWNYSVAMLSIRNNSRKWTDVFASKILSIIIVK